VATIWITYAWSDNQSGDIDFIAQELQRAGVRVQLDRWTLKTGARLWEQIDEFIQNPEECDAWLLIATQASLGSQPCREEYAYALDRALATRGVEFPVMALFPTTVDKELIPAGLRSRLYVSLRDPDWKERIVSGAEGRSPAIHSATIYPYQITIYYPSPEGVVIEVRPRAGSWSPFVAAIPKSEKTLVDLSLLHGATGRVPTGGMLSMLREGENADWAFCSATNEATPTMSYYIFCNQLPTKLLFGRDGGELFQVSFP
jgi:hypothetical protein